MRAPLHKQAHNFLLVIAVVISFVRIICKLQKKKKKKLRKNTSNNTTQISCHSLCSPTGTSEINLHKAFTSM